MWRYDTPVGAIRLDLAYRIVAILNPTSRDLQEEGSQPLFLGAPVALSFGIGESF